MHGVDHIPLKKKKLFWPVAFQTFLWAVPLYGNFSSSIKRPLKKLKTHYRLGHFEFFDSKILQTQPAGTSICKLHFRR